MTESFVDKTQRLRSFVAKCAPQDDSLCGGSDVKPLLVDDEELLDGSRGGVGEVQVSGQ